MNTPMGKVDNGGNLITAPPLLRKLYLDTYVHRLRHREMKTEFLDVFELKTTLWNYQLEYCRGNKTDDWLLKDLTKVLRKLKNNKSRDPSGYINEIFKPQVSGGNLLEGILSLANGVKSEQSFPAFMQLANITSIYKRKGSKNSLESDRGIFVTNTLKRIIDGLIYGDKYGEINRSIANDH